MAPVVVQRSRVESPDMRNACKETLQRSHQSKKNTPVENIKLGEANIEKQSKVVEAKPLQESSIEEKPKSRGAKVKACLFSRKLVLVFTVLTVASLATLFAFMSESFPTMVEVHNFAGGIYQSANDIVIQMPHFAGGIYHSANDIVIQVPHFAAGIYQSANDIVIQVPHFAGGIYQSAHDIVIQVPHFAGGIYQSANNIVIQMPLHYTIGLIAMVIVGVGVALRTIVKVVFGRFGAKKAA